MGCSIQFVRLNDFAADIDSLDLSANGYALDQDGYFPVAAPIGARSVHEVITLKLQGTSKDDLAAMTQEIDEKIKQVQWWIDAPGVERYQVWLRVQLENESLPRQAQILSITPPDKIRVFVPEEINNNFIGSYSLGIERTPYWEDPYPYPTTANTSNFSTTGGMVQLSETINGDVPARLPQFSVRLDGHTTSRAFTDFWIGFKTSRFGNPANFQPVWSLKDGTPKVADTSTESDSDAYSGTRLTTTFATDTTLVTRVNIDLTQALSTPTNWADQRGTYTVLLRAKTSDVTTTSMARMIYAYTDTTNDFYPVYRSLQFISNPYATDGYQLYEMGRISIPPFRLKAGMTFYDLTIGIQAERTAGSGSLYLDCLIFIPVDEGAAKLLLQASPAFLAAGWMSAYIYADGSITGTYAETTAPTRTLGAVVCKPEGQFTLPANGEKPYIVVAAARRNTTSRNGSPLAGDTIISYSYIPRWRTLRGNAT